MEHEKATVSNISSSPFASPTPIAITASGNADESASTSVDWNTMTSLRESLAVSSVYVNLTAASISKDIETLPSSTSSSKVAPILF